MVGAFSWIMFCPGRLPCGKKAKPSLLRRSSPEREGFLRREIGWLDNSHHPDAGGMRRGGCYRIPCYFLFVRVFVLNENRRSLLGRKRIISFPDPSVSVKIVCPGDLLLIRISCCKRNARIIRRRCGLLVCVPGGLSLKLPTETFACP
jgi:hypothetical protein